MSNREIDAHYDALLDITDGNLVKAAQLVCYDITRKESKIEYCG